MAGSQLVPPLLLLSLVLLLRPDGCFAASSDTTKGVMRDTETSTSKSWTSFPSSHSSPSLMETSTNHFSLPNSEAGSTIHLRTPSSEADSISPYNPSHSEAPPTIQPSSSSTSSGLTSAFPQPKTIPHPSSGSPNSELTPTSHSSPPSSITLTLHWSSTSSSPRTEPPSMPLATTDSTSVASGPGDTGALELHRNPGVVVAVCLLVSVLLIGSVLIALRYCHQGMSEFQKLDEVSMVTMSQRSSFAHCPPE